MTRQERLESAIARLDAATNDIANDLRVLKAELGDTVSEESLNLLDANIAKLEALGADTENPVPEAQEVSEPIEDDGAW